MIKVIHKLKIGVIFGCLFLFISGCTENGFLFRSWGNYHKKETKGVYKIGEPYQVKGIWYYPKEDYHYMAKGMASFYEYDPAHLLTANGEVYTDDLMTARHRTLPLPSLVRITNLENGNTAIVRVNDRGPYVHNRLIDVSRKAAEALEFQAQGTTLVQVDILPDESRLLKQEFMQAGQTYDTVIPDEPFLPTDEAVVLDDAPMTPVYQPNSVLVEPLYAPTWASDDIDDNISQDNTSHTENALSQSTSDAVDETQPEPISDISDTSDIPDLQGHSSDIKSMIDVAKNIQQESVPVDLAPQQSLVLKPQSTQPKSMTTEAPVEPELTDIKKQSPTNYQEYYVQLGAFLNPTNAQRVKEKLSGITLIEITPKEAQRRSLLVVRAGPYKNPAEARQMLDKIKKAGYPESKIISQ